MTRTSPLGRSLTHIILALDLAGLVSNRMLHILRGYIEVFAQTSKTPLDEEVVDLFQCLASRCNASVWAANAICSEILTLWAKQKHENDGNHITTDHPQPEIPSDAVETDR